MYLCVMVRGISPVVSDILPARVYTSITSSLEGKHLQCLDATIVAFRGYRADSFGKVESVLEECGESLYIVKEVPVLQFLDPRLNTADGNGCWWYNPRAKKALLAYHYAHSNCVKRGSLSSCLGSSL